MSESVLIVGGGPAGASSALNLLEQGFRPVLVEAENFPRFHIGESLTTECVDALNRLGLDRKLLELAAPRKRGVRVFSRSPHNSFYVGAGDAWQVERARFDAMMLDTAVERGAEHVHGKATELRRNGDGWQLRVRLADDATSVLESRFVIDATGQRRFSHRQGLFGPLRAGDYARQIAFFSQYEGLVRKPDDALDTLIHHREKYEWVWMIPLSERVTSVGLVIPVDGYKSSKLPADRYMDRRLPSFSASVTERMSAATRVGAVQVLSNYSYRIDDYAADGLFCVGDSHGFIDPIFSFGVEFAVVEASYVAQAISACRQSDPTEWPGHARGYMETTTAAQAIVEDMLAYFWAYPWGFANMAHVRHREEFLELFAGRIYEIVPREGLRKMRSVMSAQGGPATGGTDPVRSPASVPNA